MKFTEELLKEFKSKYADQRGNMLNYDADIIFNFFSVKSLVQKDEFWEPLDEVIKMILEKYGHTRQLDKITEECAELIRAIQKFKYSDIDGHQNSRAELIDELADVVILMRMSSLIFPSSEINQRIVFKLGRQRSRMLRQSGVPTIEAE